ncbi:hypothetical protein VSP9026_03733 [Vibrio spartinae]|uniref:Uncharacterized protein n=1 Tax=Vibrio spartinae TaxID=1918945 RepID=A0A1N6M9F4_9VIBR|nr:hypothetical protein VSP9026_03733 [Vibrio spartinae]
MILYLACIFVVTMKHCANFIIIIELDQTFKKWPLFGLRIIECKIERW